MNGEEWRQEELKKQAEAIKTLNKEGKRKKSVDKRVTRRANSVLVKSQNEVGLDVLVEHEN